MRDGALGAEDLATETLAAHFRSAGPDSKIMRACGSALVTMTGPRAENQDRVFVARLPGLHVAGVLDGIGGMRDGAIASAQAAGAFLSSIASAEMDDLAHALGTAIVAANEAVWSFSQGMAGTTLTAIALNHHGDCHAVHAGDSRLYSLGDSLRQITVDDTLAGMLGVEDNGLDGGLMQFVGIGERLLHQEFDLSAKPLELVLLATDGFYSAMHRSERGRRESDPIAALESLMPQGFRSGLNDNATAVIVDKEMVLAELRR